MTVSEEILEFFKEEEPEYTAFINRGRATGEPRIDIGDWLVGSSWAFVNRGRTTTGEPRI